MANPKHSRRISQSAGIGFKGISDLLAKRQSKEPDSGFPGPVPNA
jgi:hypothetical protein